MTITTFPKIKIQHVDPSIIHNKRLIIIGDVHGCIATLEALLEKLSFTPDTDHLIFTGDLINKGPDSVGVVELARRYGASAVRGNHEDKILKLRGEVGLSNGGMEGSGGEIAYHQEETKPEELVNDDENDEEDDSSEESSSTESGKEKKKDKKQKKEEKKQKKKLKKELKKDKKDKKDKKSKKDKKDKKDKKKEKKFKVKDKSEGKNARENHLAHLLTHDQAHWVDSLPIILRLGHIPGMGEVIVVHAGVVPGVELEQQDPWNVMNMRSINRKKGKDEVLDTPDGNAWADLFNEHQSTLSTQDKNLRASQPMTIIYGHDARTSLRIEQYTKGLDSRCIKGDKLTALVIEKGGKQNIVQADCRDEIEE